MDIILSFFDVDNIALTILDYPISWLELIATLLGAVGVVLAAMRKAISWPITFVSVILCAVMFYEIQLYADFTLNAVFFSVTSIVGYVMWLRNKDKDTSNVKVRRNNWRTNVFLGVGLFVAWIFVSLFYVHCHELLPAIFVEPPAYPEVDSIILVCSVAGQILMMRRFAENYFMWIIVNTISTVLYFVKDVKLFAIEYLVFFFIGVYGFVNWMKHSKDQEVNNKEV